MIGRIEGTLLHVAEDRAIIDAGGIGYEVHCAAQTLANLPPVGEVARLWTDLLVREDLLQLFGFASLQDREWHRLLTTVQGVGAKVSMAILGVLGPEGVSRAIAMGDAASVKRAPGVGPKLAQRIVNELKSKAPGVMAGGSGGAARAASPMPATPPTGDASAAALSALTNLGYEPAVAAEAIARAATEAPDADEGALIKAALKALAPKG